MHQLVGLETCPGFLIWLTRPNPGPAMDRLRFVCQTQAGRSKYPQCKLCEQLPVWRLRSAGICCFVAVCMTAFLLTDVGGLLQEEVRFQQLLCMLWNNARASVAQTALPRHKPLGESRSLT